MGRDRQRELGTPSRPAPSQEQMAIGVMAALIGK
jgi:hypothetical protein